MQKINGRVYVGGTVNISEKALVRLREMGVKPPLNRYPQGGEFDSFYLPEGENGEEFFCKVGTPAIASKLKLKSE